MRRRWRSILTAHIMMTNSIATQARAISSSSAKMTPASLLLRRRYYPLHDASANADDLKPADRAVADIVGTADIYQGLAGFPAGNGFLALVVR